MAEVMHAQRPPRFTMRGICKKFGGTTALDGVDLAVAAGEVHALVGENGAGKSTLMKVLSGALTCDSGSMELDGAPFRPRNALDARRAGVSMIYQELSLAPHLSVADNVVLGMEPTSIGIVNRAEVRRQTEDALGQLGHTDIPPDAVVGSLPVAARQIVEIARSLAVGCRVLVLDEPTSSLTLQDTGRLFAVIRRLRQQGHAVVYISHFLEEVKQIADTFTVLRDGRTTARGNARETSVDSIIASMIGRKIDKLYPRSPRTPGEPVLDVRELAGVPKPDRASFTLHRGEILGIAGLVGAGRTEMLRTLFGLAPVRRGVVRLGAYTGPASPARRWRQGSGFLSEDRTGEGLANGLSITDNIMMNLSKDAARFGLILPARQEAKAREWIDRLSIRCQASRQRVRTLSGGNQQKVAVARLLHEDVDILLLDEPTKGIDVASKSQIYALMDELASGDPANGVLPKAVVIISSYFPELLGICDRIAVMCRGTLGEARPGREWSEHSLMVEATGQATT